MWIASCEIENMAKRLQIPGFPTTRQGLLKRAKRERWRSRPRKGRGGGAEYHLSDMPDPIQRCWIVRECRTEPARDESRASGLWDWFMRRPESIRKRAENRLSAVNAYFALRNLDRERTAAFRDAAEQFGVSDRSLRRWVGSIRAVPQCDWLPTLAPGYAGRTVTAEFAPEAWEYYKADYLRPDRPTAAACYRRMTRAAQAHGWKIPSLTAVKERMAREFSRVSVAAARSTKPSDIAGRAYPAQERDHSVFKAMEAVNGDGYTFYKYVDFGPAGVHRPTAWVWQDLYSSRILSWRIDVSENATMLRLALGDLVEQYGIPGYAWLDNTMAAANKWLSGGIPNRYRFKVKEEEALGIMPQLGIQVHWTTPGHGQAKPIERAFGIGGLGEMIDRHPKFSERGKKAKPIPREEFEAVMASEIAAYNAQEGRRGAVASGRSFDAVFAESYASAVIRKPVKSQRVLWMLAAENVTVSRTDGTIRLAVGTGPQGTNRYWHEELVEWGGRKVVVRFDPDRLRSPVHVFAYDGRLICEAECVLAAGFNDSEAAREHNRLRQQFKKRKKEQLKAEIRMTSIEAAALVPDAQAPEIEVPKVAAMAIGPSGKSAEEERKEARAFEENFARGVERMKAERPWNPRDYE